MIFFRTKALCCLPALLLVCLLFSGALGCIQTQMPEDIVLASPTTFDVLPTLKPTNNYDIPTPVPTKGSLLANVSLGFVGDIMIMQSQVRMAKSDEGYDFTRSFEPMRALFNSVDFMCANLETPLAGESAGFSGPAPTLPPVTEDDPTPKKPYQTFNAPDELAYNLKALGMDMLTTANNHCLDRGYEGLLRTLSVLNEAGLEYTGTFSDPDEAKYKIVDVSGVKIGFVGFAGGFNEFNKNLSTSQLESISYLYDYDYVRGSIEAAREAGAEFVVAFPHCGVELSHEPTQEHRRLFYNMIEWGADAIIASHPHVVQPMEWMEVERDGKTLRVPVVYSLGNFISNMFPAPKNYGLFVRLDITRDADGNVFATTLGFIPVYCIRQEITGGILHQTLPCFSDLEHVKPYKTLSRREREELEDAREYVIDICGEEFLMNDMNNT